MTEKGGGSWWSTLPGVLTGIAAVVTAVSGLLVAAHQAGLLGGRWASAPAPPALGGAAPGPRPVVQPSIDRTPAGQPLRLGDLTITIVNLRSAEAGGAVTYDLHYRIALRDGVQRHDPRQVVRLVADAVAYEPIRTSDPTMIGEGGAQHEALAVFRLPHRPAQIVLRFQTPDAAGEFSWSTTKQ